MEAVGNAHVYLERPSSTKAIGMLENFPFVRLACHGVSIAQDTAQRAPFFSNTKVVLKQTCL